MDQEDQTTRMCLLSQSYPQIFAAPTHSADYLSHNLFYGERHPTSPLKASLEIFGLDSCGQWYSWI